MRIRGVSVIVHRPNIVGYDGFNNPIFGQPTDEPVSNVLVGPAATTDTGADRPFGTTSALTLHFPKSYSNSLRGCSVTLPAPWGAELEWRVIGDPKPYMAENVRGDWWMPVQVEVADG